MKRNVDEEEFHHGMKFKVDNNDDDCLACR